MRLAAWLLAAMAIIALGAAPAGAAWTSQRVAQTPSGESGAPVLAGNERGDAALVFRSGSGISLALARPGREFGRPRKVPGTSNESSGRVAIDEHGNVLVVW